MEGGEFWWGISAVMEERAALLSALGVGTWLCRCGLGETMLLSLHDGVTMVPPEAAPFLRDLVQGVGGRKPPLLWLAELQVG